MPVSRRSQLKFGSAPTFTLSNLLWIAWGWNDRAWALITLQLGLFALNVRGVNKNETGPGDAPA